ncbi:hypothetical protein SJI19_03565 [Acerihabitans sp. TG2]|uniref:hypothetical protein n=1 Tax=Acerihabitans sp. TG2 TaxID=3096008 RepID=UPI002B23B494|nr:hypothetical protein [Acerihabitans sp. TG2]MEA9389641.1 hypothetical protein [Acerihabitans sp. TG2]
MNIQEVTNGPRTASMQEVSVRPIEDIAYQQLMKPVAMTGQARNEFMQAVAQGDFSPPGLAKLQALQAKLSNYLTFYSTAVRKVIGTVEKLLGSG